MLTTESWQIRKHCATLDKAHLCPPRISSLVRLSLLALEECELLDFDGLNRACEWPSRAGLCSTPRHAANTFDQSRVVSTIWTMQMCLL